MKNKLPKSFFEKKRPKIQNESENEILPIDYPENTRMVRFHLKPDVYNTEVTVDEKSLKSFKNILESDDAIYLSKVPIAEIKNAESIKKYFKN